MGSYLYRYYDPLHKELKDDEIICALKMAITYYQDGAILETKDILRFIIKAINEFEKSN